MRQTAKGFTLIELLIVIAVLGILAVAVLSAINPIEQINRSRDTGSRSDAEQLIGAIDRFYASKGFYPWVTGPSEPYDLKWTSATDGGPNSWNDNEGNPVLKKLSGETEELKSSFVKRISGADYNTLKVYNEGVPGSSTYVCFLPKSSAFLNEARDRCGSQPPTDYPGDACNECNQDNKKCYSCLP